MSRIAKAAESTLLSPIRNAESEDSKMAPHAGSAHHLKPFPNFRPLDGCHCISGSIARIFHWAGHPLSEEMLFGLGAGMGFIYWRMKTPGGEYIFVGGRGNMKGFSADLASRTGVVIREIRTASAAKAQAELLRQLKENKPVMLGGDMGYLPWFTFPREYHFGGHTFVACGYDGEDTVLCSDIDQKGAGVKKGFLATTSLAQLRQARASSFKPFPPKNLRLEFDFIHFRKPGKPEIVAAIRQVIDAALHPPIRNFGVKGMRHTADELLKWPSQLNDADLRANLFNLYIFIESGGTGGGCFRPMFARFLRESAALTGNPALRKSADDFEHIGRKFSEVGLLFKNAAKLHNPEHRIQAASKGFRDIADLEEKACQALEAAL